MEEGMFCTFKGCSKASYIKKRRYSRAGPATIQAYINYFQYKYLYKELYKALSSSITDCNQRLFILFS